MANLSNKGVYSRSFLNEISRKNLVGKVKSDSPGRYMRRLNYRTTSNYKGVDLEKLIKEDILVCETNVGDYTCIVAYKGVIHHLLGILKKQPKPNVTLQTVIKAMTDAIDDSDILIDCSCADFKYRFAYWATKYGYKYGKPETRPTKITNPKDKSGAMCKHLTALLANKKWLVKVATIVNDFIKEHDEEFRKKFNLSSDEFIINKNRYNAGKKSADSKLQKNTKSVNPKDEFDKLKNKDKDNEEELEPNIEEEN